MAPTRDPDLAYEVLIEGKPFWRFANGTVLPVVRGGDGGEGGGGNGGSGGSDGGSGGGGDGGGSGSGDGGSGGDGGGEEQLGDAGKRALAAEREKAKGEEKARKAAEKERDDFRQRLEKIEADGKSDHDKELDKIRKETDAAARKEERAKSDRRIVTAEVKAAAGGRLQDPGDATRHIDLEDFTVDDNGDVDDAAIKKAIDKLLEEKPYLATDGKRPKGDGDGGPRPPAKDTDVAPGRSRLRSAYAENSKQ